MFVRVGAVIRITFVFKAEWYFLYACTVFALLCWWMACHSHPLAVVSHAAEAWTGECFSRPCFHVCRDSCTEMESLGSMIIHCLWFYRATVLLSAAAAPFLFPTAMHEALLSVHPHQSNLDRHEIVSGLPSEATLSKTECGNTYIDM